MRLPQNWCLALVVLPALQGCGDERREDARACWPASPATAQRESLPARPDGPILDEADILSPAQEAKLDAHLRDYFQRTGNAIVLVSLASLQGEELEPFATRLFGQWGIGDAKTNRGLLVLVVPQERQVRIEVGCGLEAAIPDAIAGDIVKKDMLSAFRQGDLERGSLAGVDALEERLASTNERGPTSQICQCLTRKAA